MSKFLRDMIYGGARFEENGGAGGGGADPVDPPVDPPADPPTDPPTSNWRDTITDDNLRSVAERFNSPADAVKAVADLRKQVSVSIQRPGKDAKPEDIQKFYKALGVPDAPDGYKFEMPEGREATEADTAFQQRMAQVFHEAGIPAQSASVLNKAWNEIQTKAEQDTAEADKAFADQAESALKKEWGGDFDRNKALAGRAATDLFDDLDAAKQIEMKDGRFLLDHPAMVKMLAKVGGEMSEDGFKRMDSGEAQSLQEQADALADQKHDAYARGDSAKARELDAKQMAILQRLSK